jgi:hypothetical protein
MAAINFKEIPEAHLGGGLQDTFELFTRDFLELLGYEVFVNPSRGADGGVDVVVVERRTGVGGETHIRWLVSCKHKAHSGASVNTQDESNIKDRMESNNCKGFIGFYSTLPSSGLSNMINGLTSTHETQTFDRERIEFYLLKTAESTQLAKRYFPVSVSTWMNENPAPAEIFATQPTLKCKYCGLDLLSPKPSGIIIIWQQHDSATHKKHTDTIYWCCKGHCDQALRSSMSRTSFFETWEDIPDVAIPIVFAKWITTIMNELESGDTYSAPAFDQLKEFILSIYPYVARNPTIKEIERIKELNQIPSTP